VKFIKITIVLLFIKIAELFSLIGDLVAHFVPDEDFMEGKDHDVIYGYATDTPLNTFEIFKMIEMGWSQERPTRNYEKDFSLDDYRQEESWWAYV
jgi:hypothetical protein